MSVFKWKLAFQYWLSFPWHQFLITRKKWEHVTGPFRATIKIELSIILDNQVNLNGIQTIAFIAINIAFLRHFGPILIIQLITVYHEE